MIKYGLKMISNSGISMSTLQGYNERIYGQDFLIADPSYNQSLLESLKITSEADNSQEKKNSSIIVKTRLSNKLRLKYLFFTILFSLICIFIMKYFSDSRPILDGITTVFSIAGMYFTVKRCIEQWIAWMIVNTFSFLMWLIIALQGERVFSTVIMWGVYLVLAIYFYYQWKGDIAKS